jgi:hypothetical protein
LTLETTVGKCNLSRVIETTLREAIRRLQRQTITIIGKVGACSASQTLIIITGETIIGAGGAAKTQRGNIKKVRIASAIVANAFGCIAGIKMRCIWIHALITSGKGSRLAAFT